MQLTEVCGLVRRCVRFVATVATIAIIAINCGATIYCAEPGFRWRRCVCALCPPFAHFGEVRAQRWEAGQQWTDKTCEGEASN
jgi:hypothetical protein